MEEVRQLVAEEGREARNLVAFHVSVDTAPSRVSRKPPRSSSTSISHVSSLRRISTHTAPSRLRSASAGRDKRSELQARYWALLFGNLQRAIGEIYTTVEAHENLSECQEVILVLENYTRDFKSLCEWFRLKWEYDNTPPPQRPQSLAWEVRKTDFVRPESRRTHSVKSSPSISGKNSPSLSGHNTPSGKNSPSLSTGKSSPGSISGKISPRILTHSSTSPKANVEFFGNKTTAAKLLSKELRLSDIKEKVAIEDTTKNLTNKGDESRNAIKKETDSETAIKDDKGSKMIGKGDKIATETTSLPKNDILVVEMGTAKEYPSLPGPKQVVIKTSPKNMKMTTKIDAKEKSQAKSLKETLQTERNDDANGDHIDKTEILKNMVDGIAKSVDITNNDDNVKDVTDCENVIKKPENYDNMTSENEKVAQNQDELKENKPVGDVSIEFIAAVDNKKNPDITIEDVTHEVKKSIQTIISNDNPKDPTSEVVTDITVEIEHATEKTDISKVDINLLEPVDKNIEPKSPDPKKIDAKTDTKQLVPKPAYSQAAAKPKSATTKTEIKVNPKVISTSLTRSKTVSEINQNSRPIISQRQNMQAKRSNNRCSYPFNLTTGRPSLFDAPPSNNARTNKNNLQKTNVKLASGDSKIVNKNDELTKRAPPKRPNNLKIEEAIPEPSCKFDNIKFSSSTDTITQIDRIESTESLKTLVPDDIQFYEDMFANSIEVLNLDEVENDNDGWLTVKSRRLSRESKKQSKSHWANRFNQPSATASLPTLNMIESPKQENKPIVTSKSDVKPSKRDIKTYECSDERPDSARTLTQKSSENLQNKQYSSKNDNLKPESPVSEARIKTEPVSIENKVSSKKSVKNVLSNGKPQNKALKVISTAIIRQKSDVTGLKTRSSRNKSLGKAKNEKPKPTKAVDFESELTNNRLHSSLESLIPSGLSRSQESTETTFDFDKWKLEFKSSIDFLEDEDRLLNITSEFLKSADPVEMSEIALMTSEIEENERKISLALDFQSDVDQRKLCEEEDLLNRQIRELQQGSDIELDTETDDTETDAEILCEGNLGSSVCPMSEGLGPLAASLEDQYEPVLAGLSWAERVDTLATLEALVARYPGRAQQLHMKLSQGIRRRGSLQETLKRYQSKQARAEHQRHELQTERTKKIQQLLSRVEDVKGCRSQLIEEKRLRMEQRLQKATENRDQHLKDIVRKAHDEEEKLREIAFIKQLEAEQRRHDFLEQCRSHTARLRQMRRDRLRKLEQKAAREAAVGARRMALEAERKLHVKSLLERRRQRDARVVQLKEQTRQRRDDAAREKAAGVKSRLVALAAAADADAAALRSRILHKQDATRERHAEHLQAIRTRALQPGRQHTTSESQDVKDSIQEEQVLLGEPGVSKEKLKAIRKKSRKLQQKILTAGYEHETQLKALAQEISPLMMKNKMCRAIHQLNSIVLPVVANKIINTLNAAYCNANATPPNGHNAKNSDHVAMNSENVTKNLEIAANNSENLANNSVHVTNNSEHNAKSTDHDLDNNIRTMENNKIVHSVDCNVKIKHTAKITDHMAKISDHNAKSIDNLPNDTEKENQDGNRSKKSMKRRNSRRKHSETSADDENRNAEKVTDAVKGLKVNSVCSSMSDLSRQSRSDANTPGVLNPTQLDRTLNELYRIMEKLDKNAPERAVFTKVNGISTLGYVLHIAVADDETHKQIQTKTIVTCINTIMQAVKDCPSRAMDFLKTNGVFHAARLLLHAPEQDPDNPKDSLLATSIIELLCTVFDSIQIITKMAAKRDRIMKETHHPKPDDVSNKATEMRTNEGAELRKDGEPEDSSEQTTPLVRALRQRTHQLITYMCLTGLSSRKENLYTLLSIFASLCKPRSFDSRSNNDRTAAWQALRGALSSDLCGARTQFTTLSVAPTLPEVAETASMLKFLRAVAKQDHTLLQESFGEGGAALEFRAAAARLLAAHAPGDKEPPRHHYKHQLNRDQQASEAEAMLMNLITVIGFFVVNNPHNQEVVCGGGSGGVVRLLCGVPAGWLCSSPHSRALLPTLAALASNERAAEHIASEISLQMLDEYINSEEAKNIKLVKLIEEGRSKDKTNK